MVALKQTPTESTQTSYPTDLRRIVGENHLAFEATRAASQTDMALPPPERRSRGVSQGLPPSAMLSLLGYAYASGVYTSGEIESSSRTDGMMRYLCANHFPSATELRRFRRHHRPQLVDCLSRVFERNQRNPESGNSNQSDSARWESARGSDRWESAEVYRSEAEKRVDFAVRADSMALDE